MPDDFSAALAATIRSARAARDLSVSTLAGRSGVSRAMIAKIERGEVQPTAALLGRLSGPLGLTVSELVARAEGVPRRVARAAEQHVWTDPETGYQRRAVSPRTDGPLQLVDVTLPAGARVSYPADAYAFAGHQIWVLSGCLHFLEGDAEHVLNAGDCLELGAPQPCEYANRGEAPCRYLVAVTRRTP